MQDDLAVHDWLAISAGRHVFQDSTGVGMFDFVHGEPAVQLVKVG